MANSEIGAAESIKRLFELYGNELYQYVRYTLRDSALAEDVVQEIFIRALQAWPRFEQRSTARTWLWAIAHKYLRDVIRKKMRSMHFVGIDLDQIADKEANRNVLGPMEMENLVLSLPLSYRQVVILRIIQDRPTAEVAKLLNWPEIKVRVTLHRAIKKLRKFLSEESNRVKGEQNGLRGNQT